MREGEYILFSLTVATKDQSAVQTHCSVFISTRLLVALYQYMTLVAVDD